MKTIDHAERAAPTLWTYADLATYAKIPAASLRMMVSRGRVPHIRMGPRTVRFDQDVIRAWLVAHQSGGGM